MQTFAVSINASVADGLALLGMIFPADHVLSDLWTMTLPQIGPLIPYIMLVVILIFRPTGLMGERLSRERA